MGSHTERSSKEMTPDLWANWKWSAEAVTAHALLASWGLPLAVKLDGEDYGKLPFGARAPEVDVNQPFLLVRAQRRAKVAAVSLMPRPEQEEVKVSTVTPELPGKVKRSSSRSTAKNKQKKDVNKKVVNKSARKGLLTKPAANSLWCERKDSQREVKSAEQVKKTKQKVRQKMKEKEPHEDADEDTWQVVGPPLILPLSYPGWFHVLTLPNQEGRTWNRIRDVTSSRLCRFLSCTPLATYSFAQCGSSGGKTFVKHFTPAGEVFQAIKVCNYSGKQTDDSCCNWLFVNNVSKPDNKYLLCTDTSGKEMLLPLSTQGEFKSVSPDGPLDGKGGAIYRLEEIITRRASLPAVVRLVYGQTPWSTDKFTGTLKLESQHWEETIVACSLGREGHTLMEIPVDARVRFLPALNFDLLLHDDVIQEALGYCDGHMNDYMTSIKVVQNFYPEEESLKSSQRTLPPLPTKPPPSEEEESRQRNMLRVKKPRKIKQVDSGISCDDSKTMSDCETLTLDSDYETIPFDKRRRNISTSESQNASSENHRDMKHALEDEEGYLVPRSIRKPPPVVYPKPAQLMKDREHLCQENMVQGRCYGSNTFPTNSKPLRRRRRHVFGDDILTILDCDESDQKSSSSGTADVLASRDKPMLPMKEKKRREHSLTLPTQSEAFANKRLDDFLSDSLEQLGIAPQVEEPQGEACNQSEKGIDATKEERKGNPRSGKEPSLKTREDIEAFLNHLFDCNTLGNASPRPCQRTNSYQSELFAHPRDQRSIIPLHRNSRSLSQYTLLPYRIATSTNVGDVPHREHSCFDPPVAMRDGADSSFDPPPVMYDLTRGKYSPVHSRSQSVPREDTFHRATLSPVNVPPLDTGSSISSTDTLHLAMATGLLRNETDEGPEYANTMQLHENSSSSRESEERDSSSLSSIYRHMHLAPSPSSLLPCRRCVRQLSLTDSGVFVSPPRRQMQQDCDCACQSVSDWSWCPPDDLSALSVQEVMLCLRYIGLGDETVVLFSDAQIDGQQLVELDNNLLMEGFPTVNALQRKKIIDFIHGWRPKIWV